MILSLSATTFYPLKNLTSVQHNITVLSLCLSSKLPPFNRSPHHNSASISCFSHKATCSAHHNILYFTTNMSIPHHPWTSSFCNVLMIRYHFTEHISHNTSTTEFPTHLHLVLIHYKHSYKTCINYVMCTCVHTHGDSKLHRINVRIMRCKNWNQKSL